MADFLITAVYNLDLLLFVFLTVFIGYFLTGFTLFFYWGNLGVRGIFYTAQLLLITLFTTTIAVLYKTLRFGTIFSFQIGELVLSENFSFYNQISFDVLALLGVSVVVVLTIIVLTFGIEYMLREALAYNVIVTLVIFSSCILCFIVSQSFGLMVMFWELSGTFSLFLIDMYYCRIRTTQAVSRSFAISRFSDFWMFLAAAEILILCTNDTLSTLFETLVRQQFELSIVAAYLIDITSATLILFSVFMAAACKCAQFLLFVWLPDAMEAPTPASALIHSSTLVVMGILMLLKFSTILYLSVQVLYVMVLIGSITIVYGAVFSTRTSDLKKAVAYSTISQVGYLFCGCGFLAFRETLLYLIVHALCKAMLFIFVGYIVHIFGGTTSLRKMGGIFFIVPDIAIYTFILCITLAGAPYTIGFFAKELIVYHILNTFGAISYFILCCWIIAFVCTPIYLYRICILPLFGRPRATRKVFRNIAPLNLNFFFTQQDLLHVDNTNMYKFLNQIQRWVVQGRFFMYMHFIIIIVILFFGEFLALLIAGFFNTSTTLFPNVVEDASVFAMTSFGITNYYSNRNYQLLIIILFTVVTIYFATLNQQNTFNWIITSALVCICILLIFTECCNILYNDLNLLQYVNIVDYFTIPKYRYCAINCVFPDGNIWWNCLPLKIYLI